MSYVTTFEHHLYMLLFSRRTDRGVGFASPRANPFESEPEVRYTKIDRTKMSCLFCVSNVRERVQMSGGHRFAPTEPAGETSNPFVSEPEVRYTKIDRTKMSCLFCVNNVRERIRTPDTLVRSQVLYPAELHTHIKLMPFGQCP